MIQPIYTSVTNANVKPCGKKGTPISCEPIPLLRNNYLGEYRTELEKAKVRKNLGIADEASLLWGNIAGTIEDLEDLILYVESKLDYTTEVNENIHTVKEALDYALYFIGQYEDNTEEITALRTDIEKVKSDITELENSLNAKIQSNTNTINTLRSNIDAINTRIDGINDAIKNIDVDKNIQKWITDHLRNSKTIEVKEDDTLEVILSLLENNAVHLILQDITTDEGTSTITLPGIYVEDLNPKINALKEEVKEDLTYLTELPNETTSSVLEGTTVELLKGKPFNEIIDTLLFPTYVRDLVLPEVSYSPLPELVKVGSSLLHPTLTFTQNDAGEEISRAETITYNDSPVTETYTSIGTYIYTGTVEYNEGEYLVDNKGTTTDKRIEAGSISTTSSTIATYPWYSGNESGLVEQNLVPFNQLSGTVDFSLSGKAIIKLPGSNTQLNSFTVDGGLGYLNVDLTGWVTSTEEMNGFPYKVWTKIDSYSSVLPHRINFILSE